MTIAIIDAREQRYIVTTNSTELVAPLAYAATSAATRAELAAAQTQEIVADLSRDAQTFVGLDGGQALVDGANVSVGGIFWRDAVQETGSLAAVELFVRNPATINLAVYRGSVSALVRVALTSFVTTVGGAQTVTLASPISVQAGDILAMQSSTQGAYAVAGYATYRTGYNFSAPVLPENVSLPDPPSTNVQLQARFVIDYREKVVTAESFEQLEQAADRGESAAQATDLLYSQIIEFIGLTGDALLVDGGASGQGSVYWRNAVDHQGTLASLDIFDKTAATVNIAVYRGPLDAKSRVGLTTFSTIGSGSQRRVTLSQPIAVIPGDIIAMQSSVAGAFSAKNVQSGDAGYSYGGPTLPATINLDSPPSTGGQFQVRFRIEYSEQVVTAERFLALEAGEASTPVLGIAGFSARGTSPCNLSAQIVGPAPESISLQWGEYVLTFDGSWRGMTLPVDWAQPVGVVAEGNSLTDINDSDTGGGWATKYAARLGVPVYGLAKYSADARQPYRSGAIPLLLSVAGNQLPAGGTSVAVTIINGAPPGANNPASPLFTFSGDTITQNNTITGYAAGRHVTLAVTQAGGSDYRITADVGASAVAFPPSTLFVPDFKFLMQSVDIVAMPGINYFYDGNASDLLSQQAKSDVLRIFRLQRGNRMIIMGSPAAESWVPGTPQHTAIRNWNAWLKATYPDNYAIDAEGRDTLARLVASGNGSAGDNADAANGVTPRSLRKANDPLHLNTAGQQILADLAFEFRSLQRTPPAITGSTVFTLTATSGAGSVTDVQRVTNP